MKVIAIAYKRERFGLLVPVRRVGTRCRQALWLCRCDCGRRVRVLINNLRRGHTKSCGCLRSTVGRARATHGETRGGKQSREWISWCLAKGRCENPSNPAYARYGGRGIKMCARWARSFEAFLADMGRKPTPDHTLDRIDNNKGYVPGNTRWATRTQQSRNRRNMRLITLLGRTGTLPDWCDWMKLPLGRVYQRIRKGMAPIEALGLI